MSDALRRADLLALARRSIETALGNEPAPALPERPHADDPSQGVFVTLRLRGELRGCIGTLTTPAGLARTVVEFARNAAFHDPRFPPVAREEWPGIDIEISIMTPPVRIEADEVVPGRHGLILELSGRRGLLLPQVATEWGFSREQFLDALAQKAGLPPGAWKSPEARLFGFEAEVFSERGADGGS